MCLQSDERKIRVMMRTVSLVKVLQTLDARPVQNYKIWTSVPPNRGIWVTLIISSMPLWTMWKLRPNWKLLFQCYQFAQNFTVLEFLTKKGETYNTIEKSIQMLIRMWHFFVSFCNFQHIIQGLAGRAAYHQNIIRRYWNCWNKQLFKRGLQELLFL